MWLAPGHTIDQSANASGSRRFAFIEELRGISALLVVLYHAHEGRHISHVMASLPAWLRWPIEHGHLGVAVFFVLSGFVIAHSLAGRKVTASYALTFLARRFVRLAPPYWFAIALLIAFAVLSDLVLGSRKMAEITTGQVAAHTLYLQEAFKYPQLNPVFWTLCLEVQFYIVFVALMALAYGHAQATGSSHGYAIIFAFAALASLLWPLGIANAKLVEGSFIALWYSFLLGVGAFWSWRRPALLPAFLAYAALLLMAGLLLNDTTTATCALTAFVLAMVARFALLESGIGWRWLQWLGAISYSLYLTHNTISGAVFRIGAFSSERTLTTELFWWLAALAASMLVASALCELVEKPSMRLARHISLGRHPNMSKSIA